ncbi:hypothetical protein CC1G_00736 [Coprinopsis cinerea okayama7|uniref:Uncharacterized protein n=1 Tax=Coprinopsis cinerea (strain Okayama-7 / 130 / ATCC MYA-4618 / FGSC 9003) TaxID=240176 RepID=A8N3I0_COPC7|nr:hypothetical protein CC1G_00736 [Coprinopsis cinerea okayama7\|eukprot:XP_001829557.2 hypothetical protein CC1G_00736 [Coprinopsis cinerea okayama7\
MTYYLHAYSYLGGYWYPSGLTLCGLLAGACSHSETAQKHTTNYFRKSTTPKTSYAQKE